MYYARRNAPRRPVALVASLGKWPLGFQGARQTSFGYAPRAEWSSAAAGLYDPGMADERWVEAVLKVQGEVTWMHDPDGAVPPEGVALRGRRPDEGIFVFFNGERVGTLLEYPRFDGNRYDVLGDARGTRVTIIDHTEIVCMLELSHVAAAQV